MMKLKKPARLFFLILCACAVLPACNKSGNKGGTKAANRGGAAATAQPAKRVMVPEHYLVKETTRMELWSGGLFMDLGASDQHKYTRGQQHDRWGEPVAGTPSYLSARAKARLFFSLLDEPFVQVWFRARSSVPGQTLAMKVEGFRTEAVALSSEWEVYKAPMPRAPSLGHKTMAFFFGKIVPGDLADIDWIWLRAGSEERTPPTLRTAVRKYGRPMRGLVADGERTYSYYMSAPAGASLEFSFGATCPCLYTVEAHMDGAPRQLLVRNKATKGKWSQEKVDLTSVAGKPGRLVLRSACGGCEGTWGDPVIFRPGPTPPPKQDKQPVARNLIVIVLDSARQDLYRPFNPKSPVKTPALDGLARAGTIFPLAQTNSNWTLPSVSTLLTGTYLSRHLWNGDKLRAIPPDQPLISKHLQTRGFATAAFMGMPILNGACGFKRGWSHFENRYDKAGKNDPMDLYPDALGWIKKHKSRRFFVYLHAFGPHLPLDYRKGITEEYFKNKEYKGPVGKRVSEKLSRTKEVVKSFTSDDQARVLAMYQGEAAYNDHYLGRFLDGLKKLGVMRSSLVVFTNDHGEEVFDRGGYGHGHGLQAELIATPLIMRFAPIFKPGLVSRAPISLVDLVPTSLEVLGLAPMGGLHGVSVLPALRGRPALEPPYLLADAGPERGVRLDGYKLLLLPGGARLFDLDSDPGELKNLFKSHRVTARALEVMLSEGAAIPAKRLRRQGVATPWRPKPTPARLDRNVKKRLEALGYVGN